jgi:hypothetical protein
MEHISRRAALIVVFAMLTAMLALPAMAQESVDVGDTIDDYIDVGEVDEEPELVGVVRDRGRPAAPAQVLGERERLAVTGADLALIAGFGALLVGLGIVAVRSGRRATARR